MKMNRKGVELGNLLSLFFVLILLFLLMGVFIALAIGMAAGKPKNMPQFFSEMPSEDLMLQKVNVNINGQMRQMTVIEMIREYELSKKIIDNVRIYKFNLVDPLESMVGAEKKVLAIFVGDKPRPSTYYDSRFRDNPADVFLRANKGSASNDYAPEGRSKIIPYENAHLIRSASFLANGNKVYVDYYWGKCLSAYQGVCAW